MSTNLCSPHNSLGGEHEAHDQYSLYKERNMTMLSKQLQEAINEQIKVEISSAYGYLSMSAYLESVSMSGIAHWMRVQHQEEISHALKFFDYVHERGGRVVLEAIDRPLGDFKSVRDVFQHVAENERKVTMMINKVYEMALKDNDYAAQVELQWFIKEQVEEEKSVATILDQIALVGDQGVPLLMLDRQLGARSPK